MLKKTIPLLALAAVAHGANLRRHLGGKGAATKPAGFGKVGSTSGSGSSTMDFDRLLSELEKVDDLSDAIDASTGAEGNDGPTTADSADADPDKCGCFANGAEHENFCESGAFPDSESCEANDGSGRCHWGPAENPACAPGWEPAESSATGATGASSGDGGMTVHEDCKDACPRDETEACQAACEIACSEDPFNAACEECATSKGCYDCWECHKNLPQDVEDQDDATGATGGEVKADATDPPPAPTMGEGPLSCGDCGGEPCQYCDTNGCCTTDPSGKYCRDEDAARVAAGAGAAAADTHCIPDEQVSKKPPRAEKKNSFLETAEGPSDDEEPDECAASCPEPTTENCKIDCNDACEDPASEECEFCAKEHGCHDCWKCHMEPDEDTALPPVDATGSATGADGDSKDKKEETSAATGGATGGKQDHQHHAAKDLEGQSCDSVWTDCNGCTSTGGYCGTPSGALGEEGGHAAVVVCGEHNCPKKDEQEEHQHEDPCGCDERCYEKCGDACGDDIFSEACKKCADSNGCADCLDCHIDRHDKQLEEEDTEKASKDKPDAATGGATGAAN